jgi:hypothetical protein
VLYPYYLYICQWLLEGKGEEVIVVRRRRANAVLDIPAGSCLVLATQHEAHTKKEEEDEKKKTNNEAEVYDAAVVPIGPHIQFQPFHRKKEGRLWS